MKKVVMLSTFILLATPLIAGHLWFNTVSNDTLTADTTTQVCNISRTAMYLREITFTYDHDDACVGVDLDSSAVHLIFDSDSFTTTWDTVFRWYAAASADDQVPGMFRIFTYDTATGTVSGKLSDMRSIVSNLRIYLTNASDSVATFKAGIIWEDVYSR